MESSDLPPWVASRKLDLQDEISAIVCNQMSLAVYVFSGKQGEEEIRHLSRGDYFGEQALLRTDFRTANVVANSTTVECLVLDRE